ncbi:MAG TPA: hypothetical protein VIF12_07610 [Micavibrio sp.]
MEFEIPEKSTDRNIETLQFHSSEYKKDRNNGVLATALCAVAGCVFVASSMGAFGSKDRDREAITQRLVEDFVIKASMLTNKDSDSIVSEALKNGSKEVTFDIKANTITIPLGDIRKEAADAVEHESTALGYLGGAFLLASLGFGYYSANAQEKRKKVEDAIDVKTKAALVP